MPVKRPFLRLLIFSQFLIGGTCLFGQTFEQRGFVEGDLFGFPLTAPNDSSNAVGAFLLRWDANYKPASWITFSGGLQAETDTHHDSDRSFRLDWSDRGLLRPAFSVRNAQISLHKDHVMLDLGKQFIHWGQTDILNPTDRFAPRDYMYVVDSEPIGVWGARLNAEYKGTSADLIWTPRFTPSRIPVLDQRWALLPAGSPPTAQNAASVFPGGGQYGARINHIGKGYEVSGSFFEGYNHLPLLVPLINSETLSVQRFYPKIRTYGTDAAIPLSWFTIKTEAAFFDSRQTSDIAPRSDTYLLWVAQLERQVHEWVIAGGYAGQSVFDYRYPFYFDPERGLTKTVLAKAVWNASAPTNLTIETAIRQNGAGTWSTVEYSRQVAAHLRLIGGITVITGNRNDFLGEYRRNSFGVFKVRYSY